MVNFKLNNTTHKHILIKDFYINFTVRQLIKAGSYLGNSFINIYSRQFVIGTRLKVAIINPLKTFTGLKKALSLLFNIVEYNDSALFINCFSNGYIFNKTNGLLDRKNFYKFLSNYNFFFKGASHIKKSESRLRKVLWALYNLKEEKDNELIHVPQKYYPLINNVARNLARKVIMSWQDLKNDEAIDLSHIKTNKIFEFINSGENFLKNADNDSLKLDNLFESNNIRFIDQIFKQKPQVKNYLLNSKSNITIDNIIFFFKKLVQTMELTKKNRRINVRFMKKKEQLNFDFLLNSFFFTRKEQFNNQKYLKKINNNFNANPNDKIKRLSKLFILRRFFFNLQYMSKRLKLRWLDRASEMIEKGQKHHYRSRNFVRKLKTFFNKNFQEPQNINNIFFNRKKNINLFLKDNKRYKKLDNIKNFIFIKQSILKNKLSILDTRKKMIKSYIKKQKKKVRSQIYMRRRFLEKGIQLKRALRIYTDRFQTISSPLIFFVEGFWYYGLVSNGYVVPKTRYPTLAISLNLPAHNAYVWFANEFKSSRVPLVSLLDSNLNGRFVDFFIPSNDDSFSILFFYKALFENTLKFAFLKRLLFFIAFKIIC